MSKTITLQDLAALVGGNIAQGAPDTVITGLNSLAEAAQGQVTFLGNPKYAALVATTEASAVLIPPGFKERCPSKAFITVENPTMAFSSAIHYFSPERPKPCPGVHPSAVVAESAQFDRSKVHVGATAVIDTGAQLGDGCVIHPGAYIGHNARLGPDCVIHPNAVIKDGCVLGARVIIHSSTVIGSDGFGYEFVKGRYMKIEQVGIVEIGDDVEIGACSTVDRARFGRTVIGDGTKIDNLVQIAHNVSIGQHCAFASQVGIAGSTKLGDYVIMGGQSGAAGHLEVTDKVTILGRGGVIKDITEPGHYTGFPARPLQEGRRLMAAPAFVPGLQKRIKELERRLAELEQRQA